MLRVKAVAKSRHASSDLIELYAFFASVCKGLIGISRARSNSTII